MISSIFLLSVSTLSFNEKANENNDSDTTNPIAMDIEYEAKASDFENGELVNINRQKIAILESDLTLFGAATSDS